LAGTAIDTVAIQRAARGHVPKIRILIASAHAIVRTGLGTLLRTVRDFVIVGEMDLSHLVNPPLPLVPDVFLLELTEAGFHGLRITANLLRVAPEAAVVVFSSNENPSYVRSILAMGVRGYVLRSALNEELYEAIRIVHRGKRYIDPRLSDSITEMLLGRTGAIMHQPRVTRLSKRESQVLREIAIGFTNKSIARKLGLSTKTIQTYRARIYEKLELRTRADLVHYAIAHGILDSIESFG
jgi:DNA-binding NarL/FixJ family response regulator